MTFFIPFDNALLHYAVKTFLAGVVASASANPVLRCRKCSRENAVIVIERNETETFMYRVEQTEQAQILMTYGGDIYQEKW